MSAFYLFFCAACIGALEGVTEWLPISSTGHMLLFEHLLGMKNGVSEAFYSFFLVAVQLGAVMAVIVLYFDKLNPWGRKKDAREKRRTLSLWGRVFIGVLPAALIGIPLDDFFEEHFYTAFVIAAALIIYGVAFLFIEGRGRGRACRVESVFDISYRDALLIGCFQVLSLIPGTSRSGSTILGGMLLGISRTASAEFSFFMSAPVMLGASLVRGGKFLSSGAPLASGEASLLLIGALTAFLVSLLVIRALMNYVAKQDFRVFGVYRILLGMLVLILNI